jgi:CubicO group peptidase (beta-lactamase class C family)
MKYAVFFLTIILLMNLSAAAQSRQQQKVDSVFHSVEKYFNQKNADAIYNMAGADFQKELTIDAFHDVTGKQLFPLGDIKKSSLLSFVNNNVATYKLEFANMTLQLMVSLDKRDKLDLFLFQEYDEPAADKTAMVATSNPLKTEMDKQVDSVARTYIQKSTTVGLSIGIIKGGKTTVYGYGETVKRNGKIPDADNFFELGSVTKTFTAILLAYYVETGKVKLDDPITDFLPDSVAVNPELKGITLLELINHTSGLERIPDNLFSHASDPLNPYKDYTIQLLDTYLKTCKLKSKPGEVYAFSNLGVGLLGSILEGIGKEPYEELVRELISMPLNMFSTDEDINPLLAPRFVQVYNQSGLPTPAWDFQVLAASGALRSTMHDMLLYAQANLHTGKDDLSKAIELTHRITFTREVKIAMAWHIITVEGVDYIFHNGDTNGSSSFVAFNVKKNIAVVILSNAAESTDGIGTGILRKIQ